MNKFFITLSFCLVTLTFFAQSRKEMIELLNKRVDSLNQIVRTERQYKAKLKTQIEQQRVQTDDLNKQFEQQRLQIDDLNELNNKLSRDIENLEAYKSRLIETSTEKEAAYEKMLKLKQDSLALVVTELKKHKPVPLVNKTIVKQSNTDLIKSVTIGTQVWMVKNLNVVKFRNGVPIREAKTKEQWKNAGQNKQAAWCYYNNDPKNGVKYGRLYNWYAVVDDNGLCPTGWHVPSYEEWNTLLNYLGGEFYSGAKMKANSGWINFGNGTNQSGFSGLSGGTRHGLGGYEAIGYGGFWWSSSEDNVDDASPRFLDSANDYMESKSSTKKAGFSVRCLRD